MRNIPGIVLGFLLLVACSSKPPATDRLPSTAVTPAERCRRVKAIQIQAHRGSFDRPENMLTAFRRAADLGADAVEMDLQVSQDDVIMVAHDAYLKSQCLLNGQVLENQVFFRDLTRSQIQAFDCGSRISVGVAVPGEKISTLLEVLNALAPIKTKSGAPLGLNLEIKFSAAPSQARFYPTRERYIELFLKTLDACSADKACAIDPSRIMVQSFDVEMLKLLRQRRSNLLISPLLSDVRPVNEILNVLPTTLITPHESQVTPELLQALHGRTPPVRVIPWTVNEIGRAQELLDMGVDGFITDHVEMFHRDRVICTKSPN